MKRAKIDEKGEKRSGWIRQSMLKVCDGGNEGRDKLYRYHADGLSARWAAEGSERGRLPTELARLWVLPSAVPLWVARHSESLRCRVARL